MDLGHAFKEYIPQARATQPVTDLSPHVDGGTGGASGTNVTAGADAKRVLHGSVAIILVALMLLWMMGALAFKGAKL